MPHHHIGTGEQLLTRQTVARMRRILVTRSDVTEFMAGASFH